MFQTTLTSPDVPVDLPPSFFFNTSWDIRVNHRRDDFNYCKNYFFMTKKLVFLIPFHDKRYFKMKHAVVFATRWSKESPLRCLHNYEWTACRGKSLARSPEPWTPRAHVFRMCVGQRRHDKTSCDVISVRLDPALLPLPAMEVAASLLNPVSCVLFTFIEVIVSHEEGCLVLMVREKKSVVSCGSSGSFYEWHNFVRLETKIKTHGKHIGGKVDRLGWCMKFSWTITLTTLLIYSCSCSWNISEATWTWQRSTLSPQPLLWEVRDRQVGKNNSGN